MQSFSDDQLTFWSTVYCLDKNNTEEYTVSYNTKRKMIYLNFSPPLFLKKCHYKQFKLVVYEDTRLNLP